MDELPRILLLGVKQSGKTSIRKVVLQGMAPHETTFLPATTDIRKEVTKNDFLEFNVWDVPGQEDITMDSKIDLEQILSKCGAIIFVLDCRQSLASKDTEYVSAVKRLIESIVRVQRTKPTLRVDVFMHKIDALNESQQSDLLRKLRTQVLEGVQARCEKCDLSQCVNYHLTSIFDSSVFEAFSTVVQRLIVQRAHVAMLLELLNTQCKLTRSFLFDVQTRLCLAHAGSYLVDESQIYELSSDFVQMVKSLQSVYGGSNAQTPLYDDALQSEATLTDGADRLVVSLRRLSRSLVFVGVAESPDPRAAPIVNYNVDVVRDAISKMFGIAEDAPQSR